jgi:acetyltransferase-like isoleucine patch superfamily enzyme
MLINLRGKLLWRLGKLLRRIEHETNKIKATSLLSEFKSVGSGCSLQWPLKVDGAEHITLGKNVNISWNGWLYAADQYFNHKFDPEIVIGDSTYIGNNCHIVACNKIQIGKDVLIADRCYISDNLHEYKNISLPIRDNRILIPGVINIGDSSWIGENVSIFGDVTIGKHCVIGANSVVTRDVPDYSVAVGIPARVIKRYDFVSNQWRKAYKNGKFEKHPCVMASEDGEDFIAPALSR